MQLVFSHPCYSYYYDTQYVTEVSYLSQAFVRVFCYWHQYLSRKQPISIMQSRIIINLAHTLLLLTISKINLFYKRLPYGIISSENTMNQQKCQYIGNKKAEYETISRNNMDLILGLPNV